MSQAIEKIIHELYSDEPVDIVEINIKGSRRNRVIQVLLDQTGGIKLDECVRLSRKLAHVLEPLEDELGLERYRLEVSSPGLDRPLKTQRDFERNLGRRVSLQWQHDGLVETLEGLIEEAGELALALALKKEMRTIPYEEIKKALIQIDWTS